MKRSGRGVLCLLSIAFACRAQQPDLRAKPSPQYIEPTTPSKTQTSPQTDPPTDEPGAQIPDHVSLPFATAGESVADAALVVSQDESDEAAISASVLAGDFAIDGDLGPLLRGELRALTVRWTGAIDDPLIGTGTAQISVGSIQQEVALAAVIGDPSLPWPAWETDEWGTKALAPFPSAPFAGGSGEWDDASVLVFAPWQLTDHGDIGIVTHLHGFYATVDETLADERMLELHAMSGRDAIFVAPQGPLDAASGDFGALEEPSGHARLIRDVVSVLYRDGLIEQPVIGTAVLSSHSGGYAAAASLIDQGGIPLAAVLLYDSVYGYISTFQDYVNDGGVLFSNYTATGGTDVNNLSLRDALEADGISVSHDLRTDHLLINPAAIGPTSSPHDYVMRDGLAHARWLAASPLPRSPLAPPELLSVISDGTEAIVSWRASRVDLEVLIEGSDDGVTWEEIGRGTGSSRVVPARPQIRLVGTGGYPSDSYAGGGSDWLVVDGFDRVFGGSYVAPTHDFAARLGITLGGASTAKDDAIAEGSIDLRDWDNVLWLLGDEGTADITFDTDTQAAITAYLAVGGDILVSGAELGYATDTTLLDTLGITYIADDAGAQSAGGFPFGVIYPEDYPDVLDAEETVWSYSTGGGAAVGHDHEVLAVGFALETMEDDTLVSAMAELTAWLAL